MVDVVGLGGWAYDLGTMNSRCKALGGMHTGVEGWVDAVI